jgi:hypothetical protein
MKKTCALILAAIAFCSVARGQQTAKMTPSGIGYLEYLPSGYNSNSEKYPVVISLHGYKEKGTSSTSPNLVLRDLKRVANVGLPKYVKHGQKYPFILISPQLKNNHGTWPPSFVMEVINHVKRTLRIDERRIYLTGLSLGGFGVWRTAGEYPQVFAAIAPVCSGGNALDKAAAIASENLPVWGFHGSSDHIVSYSVSANMINAINAAPKKPNPLAKLTIFPGMGHIIWDKAYQQTDVLNWMLSHRKGGGAPAPPTNSDPVVNAGADKSIALPANSVELEASASDEEGTIASYHWTKTSGPHATLHDTNTPKLKVSDLTEGVYHFRITVKDISGGSASDDVIVTVKASDNKSPVVNAGADRVLTLPANNINLVGSASDPDGKIVSQQWEKIAGGTLSANDFRSMALTVSGLVEGSYTFRLTVQDDQGATASDEVVVVVRGESGAANKNPIARAGGDVSLTFPENSTELMGSGIDEDGSVSSYLWTKVSGGSATWSEATSPVLKVSGLSVGTYQFKLTVKDNEGAIGEDVVAIVVRPAAQQDQENVEIIPIDYNGNRNTWSRPATLYHAQPWLGGH